MKFELNEVKFSGTDWTAEELGTLREGLQKGDQLKFAKMKADKQVTVLITEKGEKAPNKQVVCSKVISAALKAAVAKGVEHKKLLKSLLSLRVIKNDTGAFIVAPVGQIGESFTFEEVEKAEAVDYQELVAF